MVQYTPQILRQSLHPTWNLSPCRPLRWPPFMSRGQSLKLGPSRSHRLRTSPSPSDEQAANLLICGCGTQVPTLSRSLLLRGPSGSTQSPSSSNVPIFDRISGFTLTLSVPLRSSAPSFSLIHSSSLVAPWASSPPARLCEMVPLAFHWASRPMIAPRPVSPPASPRLSPSAPPSGST